MTTPFFPFSSCCIVATEYPVVNMPTALRLAPKFTLVAIHCPDLRSSSLASAHKLDLRILVISRYVAIL